MLRNVCLSSLLRRLGGRVAIGILAAAPLACSDDTDSGDVCVASPATDTVEEDTLVTYNASITGDATILSITYRNAAGNNITLSNPALPFSALADLEAGSTIQISARGTTGPGGNVHAGYTIPDPVDPIVVSASCRQ
jgi:hypothetical protein